MKNHLKNHGYNPVALGISAMQFIAQDETLTAQFLQDSGAAPEDLRLIPEQALALSTLTFLFNNEPHLLAFAKGQGCAPETVVDCYEQLEKPLHWT